MEEHTTVDQDIGIQAHNESKNPVLPCRNGCGMKGRQAAREKHEATHCPLRPLPCDLCGEDVPKRHMKVHQRNSCLDRQVKCLMCRQPIKVRDMDDHYALCRPETPAEERLRRLEAIKAKEGPHRCDLCQEVVSIEFEDQHLASTCRLVECPECRKPILKKDREKHLANECKETNASCQRCGVAIKRRELLRHQKEECTQRTIQCETCGEVIIAAELEEHKKESCIQETVECLLKCGCPEMLRADITQHLELECVLREQRCEGCTNTFHARDLPDHMATCMPLNDHWEEAVSSLGESFSKPSLERRMRKLLEAWRNEPEIALIALADCKGDVQYAAERLRRRPYYDHLKLICEVCDVTRFVSRKRPVSKQKKRVQERVKQEGLKVTASVPVMNNNRALEESDEDLSGLKKTLTSATIIK